MADVWLLETPDSECSTKIWMCLSCYLMHNTAHDSALHQSQCPSFSQCLQLEVVHSDNLIPKRLKCTLCMAQFVPASDDSCRHSCQRTQTYLKAREAIQKKNDSILQVQSNLSELENPDAARFFTELQNLNECDKRRGKKQKRSKCGRNAAEVPDTQHQNKKLASKNLTTKAVINKALCKIIAYEDPLPNISTVIGSIKWKCSICKIICHSFNTYATHNIHSHHLIIPPLFCERKIAGLLLQALSLKDPKKAKSYHVVITPGPSAKWIPTSICRSCGSRFDSAFEYFTHEFGKGKSGHNKSVSTSRRDSRGNDFLADSMLFDMKPTILRRDTAAVIASQTTREDAGRSMLRRQPKRKTCVDCERHNKETRPKQPVVASTAVGSSSSTSAQVGTTSSTSSIIEMTFEAEESTCSRSGKSPPPIGSDDSEDLLQDDSSSTTGQEFRVLFDPHKVKLEKATQSLPGNDFESLDEAEDNKKHARAKISIESVSSTEDGEETMVSGYPRGMAQDPLCLEVKDIHSMRSKEVGDHE